MAVRSVSDSGSSAPAPAPHLVTSPVWSLQAWELEITVAGEQVTIPPIPAADWLAVLMGEDLWAEDLFPGLLDEDDKAWVEDCLFAGDLGLEEMHDLAMEILGQVAGRPWWVALRVVGTAKSNWDVIGGALALRGVDAAKISLGAWLDVATMLMINHMETSRVSMWLMQLEAPPQGTEAAEPEIDANQFLAMG